MTDTYVVLDIETTGLSPYEDKIIEFGAIKCVGGEITGRYETLINPEIPIKSNITAITGINNNMVANAPVISCVIKEILDFVGDSVIVGHNIGFDYRFIAKAAADFGIKYHADVIDTFILAKQLIEDIGSRSLESLCDYFQITNVHHRAMADVMSTYEIFNKFMAMSGFEAKTSRMIFKANKVLPATEKQIKFLLDLINRYDIPYEKNIKSLTKSEASREIDKILSVYGIIR